MLYDTFLGRGNIMKHSLLIILSMISHHVFSSSPSFDKLNQWSKYGETADAPTSLLDASTALTLSIHLKEAKMLIEASQDYYQTGELASILEKRINELLNKNPSLSQTDAVDLVNSQAIKAIQTLAKRPDEDMQ